MLALVICRFPVVLSGAIEDGAAGLGETASPFNMRFIYQDREASSFIPDTGPRWVAPDKVRPGLYAWQTIILDASTQSDQ
jgi:hypothetical protein